METKLSNLELINIVITSARLVMDELGSGFTENIYEKALILKLREQLPYKEFSIAEQVVMPILYMNQEIGHTIADVIIKHKTDSDLCLIVELKAKASSITENDRSQIFAYMRTKKIFNGLILCFTTDGNVRTEII